MQIRTLPNWARFSSGVGQMGGKLHSAASKALTKASIDRITLGLLHRRYHHNTSRVSGIILGRAVREALKNRVPVVALESTVLTHGLPEPQNLELALALEQEIRSGNWWRQCLSGTHHSQPSPPGQVIPATVGIVRGQLIVGLSRDELNYLARLNESLPIKCSSRDLPLAQAYGLNAGTTVSGTLAIVNALGPFSGAGQMNSLRVFATGGLGGVHLDGQNSMDVSADLYQLARSGDGRTRRAIGLVSAGFKSFLDTRRSLELLESLGVTVASLRQTEGLYCATDCNHHAQTNDDASSQKEQHSRTADLRASRSGHAFPGFFTSRNKEQVGSPWRCESVQEAAQILFHCLGGSLEACSENGAERSSLDSIEAHFRQRSMLLACPIPSQFDLSAQDEQKQQQQQPRGLLGGQEQQRQLSYEEALESISKSIDKRLDLNGYEKTPLILEQLNRMTGGETLRANLELLKNNARVGAHLAHELAVMFETTRGCSGRPVNESSASQTASPVVIGCTMIDMHVRTKLDHQFRHNPHHSGVTFDGTPHLSLGGVGHNLATAIELLGHRPHFYTALAGDNLAEFARNEMAKRFPPKNTGKTLERVEIFEHHGRNGTGSSSCFALVLIDSQDGQCEYVIANVEATQALNRDTLRESRGFGRSMEQAPLVVMDANLPKQTLAYIMELCHAREVPIFLEPTDVNCLPQLVECLGEMNNIDAEHTLSSLQFLSPNQIELQRMLELFRAGQEATLGGEIANGFADVEAMALELMETHLPELRCLLVTMDKRGLLLALRTSGGESLEGAAASDIIGGWRLKSAKGNCDRSARRESGRVILKHYPCSQLVAAPISSSGAGDCFASGFISGLLLDLTLDQCVQRGFEASVIALQAMDTVPIELRQLASEIIETPKTLIN